MAAKSAQGRPARAWRMDNGACWRNSNTRTNWCCEDVEEGSGDDANAVVTDEDELFSEGGDGMTVFR